MLLLLLDMLLLVLEVLAPKKVQLLVLGFLVEAQKEHRRPMLAKVFCSGQRLLVAAALLGHRGTNELRQQISGR